MTRPASAALIVLSITLAVPARADLERRQARYLEAHTAMKDGNWIAARGILTRLWQEQPSYDVASSLATLEQREGNLARAANYLVKAIALSPPREVTEVDTYRRGLAELGEKLGKLSVEVSHPGAVVFVDGEEIGKSPLDGPVYVDPGSHTVVARLGEVSQESRVDDLLAGETRPVILRIVTPEVPKLQERPVGVPLDTTPGGERDFTSKGKRNWVPVIVSGGLGVVALGVGTYFLAARKHARADGDQALRQAEAEFGSVNPCGPSRAEERLCVKVQSSWDDFEAATHASNVSFAVGGVFLVGAVAAYLFWPKTTPANPFGSLNIDVRRATGGAVVQLSGAF